MCAKLLMISRTGPVRPSVYRRSCFISSTCMCVSFVLSLSSAPFMYMNSPPGDAAFSSSSVLVVPPLETFLLSVLAYGLTFFVSLGPFFTSGVFISSTLSFSFPFWRPPSSFFGFSVLPVDLVHSSSASLPCVFAFSPRLVFAISSLVISANSCNFPLLNANCIIFCAVHRCNT